MKLIKQIIKFGIVGLIAFGVDYGLFWLLTDVCAIHYLVSAGVAFSVSVIVNYLLSMKFVFVAKEGLTKQKEFIIFIILSLIGLGINELIMYLGVDKLFFDYLLVKLFATAIVMIFNFITKKIFIENKKVEN